MSSCDSARLEGRASLTYHFVLSFFFMGGMTIMIPTFFKYAYPRMGTTDNVTKRADQIATNLRPTQSDLILQRHYMAGSLGLAVGWGLGILSWVVTNAFEIILHLESMTVMFAILCLTGLSLISRYCVPLNSQKTRYWMNVGTAFSLTFGGPLALVTAGRGAAFD